MKASPPQACRHSKARRLAQDYVIEVVAGMTGLGKSYGIGIAQGAGMAVNDVNAAGGIDGRKLGMVGGDDNSSPARGQASGSLWAASLHQNL